LRQNIAWKGANYKRGDIRPCIPKLFIRLFLMKSHVEADFEKRWSLENPILR